MHNNPPPSFNSIPFAPRLCRRPPPPSRYPLMSDINENKKEKKKIKILADIKGLISLCCEGLRGTHFVPGKTDGKVNVLIVSF